MIARGTRQDKINKRIKNEYYYYLDDIDDIADYLYRKAKDCIGKILGLIRVYTGNKINVQLTLGQYGD